MRHIEKRDVEIKYVKERHVAERYKIEKGVAIAEIVRLSKF